MPTNYSRRPLLLRPHGDEGKVTLTRLFSLDRENNLVGSTFLNGVFTSLTEQRSLSATLLPYAEKRRRWFRPEPVHRLSEGGPQIGPPLHLPYSGTDRRGPLRILGSRDATVGVPTGPFKDDWTVSLPAASETLCKLAAEVSGASRSGAVPVLATNTCGASLATLPVVAEHFPDAVGLWIDAHGDFTHTRPTLDTLERWF